MVFLVHVALLSLTDLRDPLSTNKFMTKGTMALAASCRRLVGLAPQAQASAHEHCTLGGSSQSVEGAMSQGSARQNRVSHYSLIQYTRMLGSMMSFPTRLKKPGISASGMPAAASSFVVPPRNLR